MHPKKIQITLEYQDLLTANKAQIESYKTKKAAPMGLLFCLL